ncbi:hypothetical protein, conserved [Trypanosoma cruzi]|uniref:Uncharacterized protein n=1 Tax=Trypanosoma cruzi (strain CL Brener) TaxID=353153 RepID=Q4DKG7_TRYCC|nr:hypothetical protein, conserved [Trypanosoma cruzi]EAN93024.1 hypothetical protein, conserved [Trypanosoma cruzi]|eukprot:XP_814875.1 hypothetical protein [Trypanosoma cruzi strain CL Brener]
MHTYREGEEFNMDTVGTKPNTSHDDNATQHTRRVMFADEVEACLQSKNNHHSNGEDDGCTQQHVETATHAAVGHPPAEEETQCGKNEHKGRKGKNNRRQRRHGGHAKATAALVEAIELDEEFEENSNSLLDDYAMLLAADENAKRLSVEVQQLREQEEVYKTHRALKAMRLDQAVTEQPRRHENTESGSSRDNHRAGTTDVACGDRTPLVERPPPPPADEHDANISKAPPEASGFSKWAATLLAALTKYGTACRHHVWKLLFFFVLVFGRRLLLRSSPSSCIPARHPSAPV